MAIASLAILLGSSPAQAGYPTDLQAQGPVGYWRLNEPLSPSPAAAAANSGSLGGSANGNYNNYPTRGLPGPFNGSRGLNFDGVNQTVTAPYAPELNPAVFTIEAWLNPATANPAGNLRCVAAAMHSASPRSGWLIYQSGGPADTDAPGWQLRLYAQGGTATSLRLLVTNNVTPGTWYHLVYTFDGTTAKGYLNGELANQGDATGYVPNPDATFSVGARSDAGFPWAGQSAEVAYYGAVLTGEQIKAHYDAASTNTAGYSSQITANSPLVYYRFREPADPVAVNTGSYGTDANGIYVYKANAGQPGPRPPSAPGFEAGNAAVVFDGTGGGINLPALYVDSDTVTITAWVKANGAQAPATGLILSRAGTTTAGITFDAVNNSGFELGYNWNDDNATYNWVSGLSVPDGEWGFVALAVRPDFATLFSAKASDPLSFNSAVNPVAHAPQMFEGTTLIGGDAGFTNRFFNGGIDEVAIFDRTLSSGEIYSQFASALGNLGPRVFADPQSPSDSIYEGDTITFTVDAGGTPALTYQWRKGNSDISGATNSTYTIPSLVTGDAGSYDVVISNPYGTVTSQAATIAVNIMTAPALTQDIQGRTMYPGGTLKLTVVATGGALNYQWEKDGSPLSGATSATYLVSSADVTNGGAYKVVITNRVGTATSATANIVVVNPSAGSYAASIVADGPEAWWRLNEPAGSTVMSDAMARHDGEYVSVSGNPVTLGVPGVVSGDTDTAVSFDGSESYGLVPFSADLNNPDITIEVWAKASVLDDTGLCPVSSRFATKGCWFYTYPSGTWSGGVSSSGNNYYVPSSLPEAAIVADQWTHLVLSYGSGSSLRFYVNGQWDNQGYVDFNRNAAGPFIIGARGVDAGTVADMFFKGQVDEVAVYKRALTPAQINAHYEARFGSTTKPYFIGSFLPQTVTTGRSLSYNTSVQGSVPITLQWYKGSSPINGATTSSLEITNTVVSDTDTYTLWATNIAGVSSQSVAVTVISPVNYANVTNGLALHLRFDGDTTDSSGRNNNGTAVGSPEFVTGLIGSQALKYTTETDGANVTNASYVGLGTPADLQFGTNTSFTIGLWVKLPAASVPGDLPFISTEIGSMNNPGLGMGPSYKLGGWQWCLNDGVSPDLTITNNIDANGADGSINDGGWHNFVLTVDRTAKVANSYLDGILMVSRDITSLGSIDTGAPVTIGQDPTGLYPEAGMATLDDIGIWRQVLTPLEVTQIYSAGTTSGRSFDTVGPANVTITMTTSGSSVTLSWPSGTLQQSDSLDAGANWTPVPGASAPSYTFTPGTGNKFYRVQL
jgi:hypothetical protein